MAATVETRAKPGLWAGLFGANMAVIAALFMTGAIEPPVPYILFALNMILLAPFVRAVKQWNEQQGNMTSALRRYNFRFLGFSLLYSMVMIVAGALANEMQGNTPAMWALAIAPIVPAFGMIWAMMRYLAEETDEYQRHRAVNAAMVGLGFVLVLGTGWGFLETFSLVPHVWAWWVFPVWAIGLGVGMIWAERGGSA